MYLESLYNLAQLPEIAPEMVRQGLISTLAELYTSSPDVEIVRLTTKTLDILVITKWLIVTLVQERSPHRASIQRH